MITPSQDWILVKVIEKNSVAVSQEAMADTEQKGEIVKLGNGEKYDVNGGGIIKVNMDSYKPGDVVAWLKHAETNTPPDLKREGYRMIEATKIIGVYNVDTTDSN